MAAPRAAESQIRERQEHPLESGPEDQVERASTAMAKTHIQSTGIDTAVAPVEVPRMARLGRLRLGRRVPTEPMRRHSRDRPSLAVEGMEETAAAVAEELAAYIGKMDPTEIISHLGLSSAHLPGGAELHPLLLQARRAASFSTTPSRRRSWPAR